MTAKEKHKLRLLEFIGNLENEFPNRKDFPEICKVTKTTMYKHFTPHEFSEIENEGLELRKQNSSKRRSIVLDSLYKRAVGYDHPKFTVEKIVDGETVTETITKHLPPDKAAAQEFLDRTEGKVLEKKELKIDGKDLAPILNITLSK